MPSNNLQTILRFAEIPRAGLEIASLAASAPWLATSPRGDNHPVVVIPGFLAGDDSTRVLREFLRFLGYDVYPWGQGRNLGAARMGGYDALIDHVLAIYARAKQKVSLIGWSLGGVHALVVADQAGSAVRQVVTLGSPINNTGESSAMFESLRATARMINGQLLATPANNPLPSIDVPITTVYSRSDGVVPWQRSHLFTTADAQNRDNIEVFSSHIGLGFNPSVLYAIANRLSQREGEFATFTRAGWRALSYPTPSNQ